jgi:HD-like signal output (HDOD) protein
MSRSKTLEEKVEGITTLPTLPQVASRLMQVMSNPYASAGDVAALVSRDMSLAARVLRLANSAFYGMPRKITNLTNAVVILGNKVINTLVLTVTVYDMFPQDKESRLFDRRSFWRHCLGCGLMAKLLSKRLHRAVVFDAEEAFCAGLLHDIGKVVMEQYLHDDFRKALRYGADNGVSAFDAELRSIGYTHTDVAEWLTRQWELPSILRHPIIYHHRPGEAEEYREAIVLCHCADWLCHQLGLTLGEGPAAPQLSRAGLGELGITEEDLESVRESLPGELDNMSAFLDAAAA